MWAHGFHDGPNFWAGRFVVWRGIGGGAEDSRECVEHFSSALFADDFHDVIDFFSGDWGGPLEFDHAGEVLPVGVFRPVQHGLFEVFTRVAGENDEGENGSEVGVSETVLEGNGRKFFEGDPRKIATEPDEFVVRVDE